MRAVPSSHLRSERIIGGVLTLLLVVGYLVDWPVLRTLDAVTYDLRLSLRAQERPSDQIVIVGVDEDSLTRVGRWPWPRSTMGELIDILRESGAKVIGVEFALSEPDQTQGLQEIRGLAKEVTLQDQALAAELEATKKPDDADLRARDIYRALLQDLAEAEARLDHDAKLAASLGRTPQVVLPIAFEIGQPLGVTGEEPSPPILANATDGIDNPQDRQGFPVIEARRLTAPLPAFQRDGLAVGHINLRPDEDGVVRRELLLVDYRGHVYPSFALRAVGAFLNVPPGQVRVQLGGQISLGTIRIPTDPWLRLPVGFHRAGHAFTTVPAHAVLSGEALPETFRNKLVLLGPLAAGIADRYVTPLSPALPGVEVTATVAQNLLEQHFIAVPLWAGPFELAALLAAGTFLVWGLPRLNAGWAGAATGTAILILAGIAATVFAASGSVVSVLPACLLLGLGYTIVVAKRVLLSERRQELAEADSIETNKMLGLSLQGQGMLDLAFDTFRKCPLDESVMGLLYNLALDFERKRMFNKAVAVYEHIQTQERRFKDIEERMQRLKEVGETMMFGAGGLKKGGAEGTVVLEGGGVTPTLGRYEVVKELGRGAMGVVYLGKDPTIQRFVAIKTMRLDDVDPEQAAEVKARFFREAESAGRLSHPNIVTIYDAGEEQELGFIAMEVLEGTDLKDHCRKESLLPIARVAEIVAKVAEALDYAHGQGIVHRDIKPANIMLMKDGTPKVTDFGIARMAASSKTQTGVVLGTPSYMSPEQLAGAKVDGRSDLFSLGVVLFELLTGAKPFQADSVATLLFQIANQPHQPPATIRPDLPASCQAVIDRALQKDVTLRYQRGSEMAQDLREGFQGV